MSKTISPKRDEQLLHDIKVKFEKLEPLVSNMDELKKLTPESAYWDLVRGAKKYVNGFFKEGAELVYKSFKINGYSDKYKRYTSEIILQLRALKAKHEETPISFFILKKAS